MNACPQCGSDLMSTGSCARCDSGHTTTLLDRLAEQSESIREAYRIEAFSPDGKPEPYPIRKAIDIVEKHAGSALVELDEGDIGVVSIVNDTFVFLFGQAKVSDVPVRWQRSRDGACGSPDMDDDAGDDMC
jgi:hypothetical protein